VSNESGASDVWLMDPDGGNRKQLTSKAGHNLTPVVTSDGRYIVFSSTRAGGPNIWRMNLDGSNPKRLTSGKNESVQQISGDGRSILYTVNNNNVTNIWSQPLDGSAPKQLTDFKDSFMTGFSWSPDGKQLACLRGILLRDAVLITDQQ